MTKIIGPEIVGQIELNLNAHKSAGLGGSIGRAVRMETKRSRNEIFSMVILSLPLIQEGQLSVSGERMCTILTNRLED